MKLVEINWNPSDKQLRQFGIICLVVLPLVGLLWSFGSDVIAWLAGIGAVLAVLGLTYPQAIRPVFLLLMLVALPIGTVVSELAMLVIYFGLFLPIAVCFEILGRDALNRKIERTRLSYWEDKKTSRDLASYFRQW
jgi:diacylglycerol kinase